MGLNLRLFTVRRCGAEMAAAEKLFGTAEREVRCSRTYRNRFPVRRESLLPHPYQGYDLGPQIRAHKDLGAGELIGGRGL
jgi:hypothetical protein